MLREYIDVTTRFLSKQERTLSTNQDALPLVIEAKNEKSSEFLFKFLETYHHELKDDIDKYGAILIRGFDIRSDVDFERAVLKIKHFQAIENTFMREEGRDRVSGTTSVLHTNTIYKTGGSLKIPTFHTENYFTTDVPNYICFFCITPSVRGGETGMADMEKIYADLNPRLKEKLEDTTFFSIKWPMSQILDVYNIPVEKTDDVCDICKQFGLTITSSGKEKFVMLYKPSVLMNPVSKMKSLQAHLDMVPGIYKQVGRQFIGDYKGNDWIRLRALWRVPTLSLLLTPLKLIFNDKNMISKLKQRHVDFRQKMLKHVFTKDDVAELALGIRNYFSSFAWKSGDILLIDNTKIAHAGMPGDRSPRVIRAMICNPLKFDYSHPGVGVQTVNVSTSASLGDILTGFSAG